LIKHFNGKASNLPARGNADMAKPAKRSTMDNMNAPQKPALSELETTDAEELPGGYGKHISLTGANSL
jgi:hypothetical protein